MYSLVHSQDRIRKAIQKLHRFYNTGLEVFMTEADVQCSLYRFLCEVFRPKAVRTKVKGQNRDKNKKYDSYNEIRTIPVHAEIRSGEGKHNKFVDLCIVNPKNVITRISKRTFDPSNNKFRTHGTEWPDREQIGIEIKFNMDVRVRNGKKYVYLKNSLIRDLKKLCSYRRGWLVFVDQMGIYEDKAEFRGAMTGALHEVHKQRLKTTLNIYYLRFGEAKAWSWRPKWLTRDS